MRPLVRIPLRRYIHSFPSSAAAPRRIPDRTKITLCASLAVAGYVGWRIAGNDQHIALDASITQRPSQVAKTRLSNPDANAQATKPTTPDISPKPRSEDPGPSAETVGEHAGQPIAVEREGTPDEDEEGEGAFNPVTGEINWDCPCLGGMAHGPCGEQFRAAFSCFVFSEQEPKGIDCVERFKNMQDCFREYPDVYGEEIADDEDTPEPSPGSLATSDEPSERLPAQPSPVEPSLSSEPSFVEERQSTRKPLPREKS